ncbi:Cell surface glycoprotein 1 [Phytophthora cinnamomi]|uniref:Cell surface glycoprotein 1 n=1 Tax=Phytophthora cinnamomi TaxID=4785 RepID=UPI003559FFE4|nr:Cell surface glycoprotein 1 [Phytophthora cinnamomi]
MYATPSIPSRTHKGAVDDFLLFARASSHDDKRGQGAVAPGRGRVGQCKWIDKQEECEYGLECVVSNDWYGQCLKSVADTWGQCGGYGWTLPCKAGDKCEKKDDWYSQCIPSPDDAPGRATLRSARITSSREEVPGNEGGVLSI